MPPRIDEDCSSETEEEVLESPPRRIATTVLISGTINQKSAGHQQPSSVGSDQRDISTSDSEDSSSSATPPTSRRRSTLTPRRSVTSTPRLVNGLDIENIIDTPPKKVKYTTPDYKDSSASPISKRRKTRATFEGTKPVNYDMKYHPMDEVTRPAQAARHALQFPGATSASSVKKRRTSRKYANGTMLDKDKSPHLEDVENPFTDPVPSDWHDFNDYDRRVYILQKGAPVNGNTLPMKWPLLVNLLVGENHFTKPQLEAWGGLQALKQRYERVRLSLQKFWKAGGEVKNRNDFTILIAEDFDVYDLKGSKTRYHHSDGLEDPSAKTFNEVRTENRTVEESEQSVDEEESQEDASGGDSNGGEEQPSNEMRESLMPFFDEATLNDDSDVLSNNGNIRKEQGTFGFTALNHGAVNPSHQPSLSADRQFELKLSTTLAKANAAHDRKVAEDAASSANRIPGQGKLLGYETVYNEFVHQDEAVTYNGRQEPPMNSTKKQSSNRRSRSKGPSGEFEVYEDAGPSPKRPRSTREGVETGDDQKENHDEEESDSETWFEPPQVANATATPPLVGQEPEISQNTNNNGEAPLAVIHSEEQGGAADGAQSTSTEGTLAYDLANQSTHKNAEAPLVVVRRAEQEGAIDDAQSRHSTEGTLLNDVLLTPKSTGIQYSTPTKSIRSPSMLRESPAKTRTEMLDMFGARSSEQQVAAQKASRGSNLVTQLLDMSMPQIRRTPSG